VNSFRWKGKYTHTCTHSPVQQTLNHRETNDTSLHLRFFKWQL